VPSLKQKARKKREKYNAETQSAQRSAEEIQAFVSAR
jgi:hypothetical protein